MAITLDPANRIVESTASILDLPVFHAALRDWEDSEQGAIYPVTHRWTALDQGGGAFLCQVDGINGWKLKFPNPGNYQIAGNLNMEIVPVAGVYVERTKATAYITTSIGGSGPSADSIAAAVDAVLTTSNTLYIESHPSRSVTVLTRPKEASIKRRRRVTTLEE